MRKDIFKKGIVLGVIILFFGAGVVPSVISDTTSFGSTLYVDDDNIYGPWDGSPEHPYLRIQDAVDNAEDGDKIHVFNGVYNENVRIFEQTLCLEGEDRQNTIIDGGGNGTVVLYQAIYGMSFCFLNFTVQNGDVGLNVINSWNAAIFDNAFKNNNEGIRASGQGINIIDNHMGSNNDLGLSLQPGRYCQIRRNLISGSKVGIFLGVCFDCNIYNNVISDSGIASIHVLQSNNSIIDLNGCWPKKDGIIIEKSEDINITHNQIVNAPNSGIKLVNYAKGNDIYCNEIIGELSDDCGISIYSYSDENEIKGNTIEECSNGIYLEDSRRNVITQNNFLNNKLQATFKDSFGNKWSSNFWSDWPAELFPLRPIWGTWTRPRISLPWLVFDWLPSASQWDIC